MLPVLLNIGPIKIYTFGVFLMLSFFWGSFLLWRLVRLTSYKEEIIFDGLFIAIGLGLFFARFFYVLSNFSQFGFSILKFILINGYPGLSLYGGLIGSFLGLYFYLLAKKIKITQIIDYFIAPLFLSMAIAFFGRFFAYDGAILSLIQSLLFFLFSFLSFRFLFLIRQERLFPGFTLIFFINTFSLSLAVGEKNLIQKILLFLFLTTSLFFLYYFRIGIFLTFNKLLKGIQSYGNKIFKKGINRNRNEASSKKGGD